MNAAGRPFTNFVGGDHKVSDDTTPRNITEMWGGSMQVDWTLVFCRNSDLHYGL